LAAKNRGPGSAAHHFADAHAALRRDTAQEKSTPATAAAGVRRVASSIQIEISRCAGRSGPRRAAASSPAPRPCRRLSRANRGRSRPRWSAGCSPTTRATHWALSVGRCGGGKGSKRNVRSVTARSMRRAGSLPLKGGELRWGVCFDFNDSREGMTPTRRPSGVDLPLSGGGERRSTGEAEDRRYRFSSAFSLACQPTSASGMASVEAK